METVIVIGAGAAGMMAAGTAAVKGKKVILLEKNNKLGKKIYITGKGRCNLTNACDMDELLESITKNKRFMYSSLYGFTNEDLINLIERYGVKTKVERGNRVFPVSDKSSDVINALERYMASNNVEVRLNSEVKEILTKEGRITGVKLSNQQIIACDKLIIATGGMSYPTTGSTGDGYKFASELGHYVTPLKPGLVPLEIREEWVKELQGLSLKNVSIKAVYNNKEIHSEFGEMVFAHFGISGPIVLSMSSYINDYLEKGNVVLYLNIKPSLTEEVLDKRIQRDFEKYSKKQFKNALSELLPSKLIPVIIDLSGIPEDKFVNQITKMEREKILNLLTRLPLTIIKTRPLNEGIVTCGGVDVKEINPSTMESKKIMGLFFAGEVLDVDALTGGFNLQIAFSTGYLAGISV